MTVLATAPIVTRIEDGMYDMIAGMTKGAYNFDWGTVNQPDMAKQEFPSAEIMLVEETNLDEEDGAWANAYMNEAMFNIVVRARLSQEVNIPIYEINKELNLALDDLKKLFGTTYSTGVSIGDQIMYRGMERIIEPQGDLFIPKRMVTHWRVTYTQDRESPTTSGE